MSIFVCSIFKVLHYVLNDERRFFKENIVTNTVKEFLRFCSAMAFNILTSRLSLINKLSYKQYLDF